MSEQSESNAETLFSVFDECLNYRPHLLLEVGYNRVVDWMVHIHDATGVGIKNAELIISTQSPDRDEAMAEAIQELRELLGPASEQSHAPSESNVAAGSMFDEPPEVIEILRHADLKVAEARGALLAARSGDYEPWVKSYNEGLLAGLIEFRSWLERRPERLIAAEVDDFQRGAENSSKNAKQHPPVTTTTSAWMLRIMKNGKCECDLGEYFDRDDVLEAIAHKTAKPGEEFIPVKITTVETIEFHPENH